MDEINRISKIDGYIEIAKAVSKRSTCLKRHYGAIIVKNDEIISTGYNGSPRGLPNCCDTQDCHRLKNKHNDGDYSNCPAVHAEMNAIISAARRDMIGSTIYLYGEESDGTPIISEPCPICKRLILNSGISTGIYSLPNNKYYITHF